MKVILKEDVVSLGLSGDEVTVANGYARNYLLPKNKAVLATPQNLTLIERLKKERHIKAAKIKEEALEMAEKIKGLVCTVTKKSGESDKLFGSVTSTDIIESLKSQSVEMDKKMLQMTDPIRNLGEFSVPVKLHPEVTAEIKVNVVKEE